MFFRFSESAFVDSTSLLFRASWAGFQVGPLECWGLGCRVGVVSSGGFGVRCCFVSKPFPLKPIVSVGSVCSRRWPSPFIVNEALSSHVFALYTYIHAYTLMYLNTRLEAPAVFCVHFLVCMYACMCMYACLCACVCMYVCMYECVCMYMCVCICMSAHVDTHTHTHACHSTCRYLSSDPHPCVCMFQCVSIVP